MSLRAIAANLAYPLIRRFTRSKKLKSFPVVAAGSEMQIPLPLGVCIESLHLRFRTGSPGSYAAASAGVIGSDVANIRVTLDGVDPINDSAATIIAIQDFEKAMWNMASVNNGVLCVDLTHPQAQEIPGQDGPAYGTSTASVRNATLSITLTGTTTITMVDATYEESDVEDLGRYLRIYHLNTPLLNGDSITIDNWPFSDPTTLIRAIHIQSTTIDAFSWNADSNEDIEYQDYTLFQSQYIRYGRKPQTGWTHIPFDKRGRPKEGCPVTFQLGRLKLHSTAAAASVPLIIVTEEGNVPGQAAA